MWTVMNLCSVLILPSPDVSFGSSLEEQRDLCVILTKIHKSHSLLKWTSTTVDLERHLRAYFSHFPVLPQYSSLQVWQFQYICVSLLEWARVCWILPGYLLFATFLSGLWNWRRTGKIMCCYMKDYLCMWVHRVQSYYATFLSLSLLFCFPLFLAVLFWWLIFFSFSFPVSLRSK